MPDRDDELSAALRDYYERMAQQPAPDVTGRVMMSADRRAARLRRWGAAGAGLFAAAAVGTVVAVALVNHNQPTSVAPGHSTPTPAASASATPSSPSATPTTTLPVGPPGAPVPPGFTARSVTFVSPSEGWVLGTASCSTPPCISVLRTRDGGATWQGVPAPRIPGPGAATGGIIRFADAANGWVALGRQFQATHDGGATWSGVSFPGVPNASVADVETAGGLAYAWVDQSNQGSGAAGLYEAGIEDDAWHFVNSVPPGSGGEGRISLAGGHGWLVVGATTAYTQTDLTTWHALPSPCSVGAQLALAPANVSTVYASCTSGGSAGGARVSRTVFASHDGGQTFHPVSAPPQTGDLDGISATPDGRTLALSVTTPGPGSIQLSRDGGSHWSTAYSADQTGGAGFADLGFTTDSQGVVVLAPGQSGVLFMTRDGGTSWVAVRF